MPLFLIRHGESEGNATGIVQGRLDFGLTELGRAQATATATRLRDAGIGAVVSSPLARAAQTASIIAEALRCEVEYDEGLSEYDVGEASGLSPAQIRERFPEVVAAFRKGLRPAFPGEEGRDAFTARVSATFRRLLERDGAVAAVAHGGVVSSICAQVMGIDPRRLGSFETANCAITEVTRDRAGRAVLMRQNDTCHIDGLVTVVDRG